MLVKSIFDDHLTLLQHTVLQVVVLDKLDYCASIRNLESIQRLPNFKVRFP